VPPRTAATRVMGDRGRATSGVVLPLRPLVPHHHCASRNESIDISPSKSRRRRLPSCAFLPGLACRWLVF
jgi:hypothetical protein